MAIITMSVQLIIPFHLSLKSIILLPDYFVLVNVKIKSIGV